MTEPSILELCTELVSWAYDRNYQGSESPVFRFERWIREDPELGWAVLQELVDRAPGDAEVMSLAAFRVPQLLKRDFRSYVERVPALLRASSCLDALLDPDIFIEAAYTPRRIEPEHLAQAWLRDARNFERAKWPEHLDHDPEVRLRVALEIIERGPLKGFDSNDLDGPLLDVLIQFGERVIDGIVAAARKSATVRLAIWSVRHLGHGRVTSEIWTRFQAAAADTSPCNAKPAGAVHSLALEEDQVVEAWLARQGTQWAPWALSELVSDEPERAWETVLAIVRGSESLEEREYCGAGPLEDLVRRNPELFVSRAEEQGAKDSAFRQTLAATWITLEDVPEPLARRYFMASGRQLKVLDAPEGWSALDGAGQ